MRWERCNTLDRSAEFTLVHLFKDTDIGKDTTKAFQDNQDKETGNDYFVNTSIESSNTSTESNNYLSIYDKILNDSFNPLTLTSYEDKDDPTHRRTDSMYDDDFESQLTPIYEELSVISDMKKTASQQFVHSMCASQEENYGSTSGKDVEMKQDTENHFNARDAKNFKVPQTTTSRYWRLSKLVTSRTTGKESFVL